MGADGQVLRKGKLGDMEPCKGIFLLFVVLTEGV